MSNKAFAVVATHSKEMEGIFREISSATQEQRQGIDQINRAIMQMNELTQNSAAGAEETAASAEQLHSLASVLNEHVENLRSHIGEYDASARRSSVSGSSSGRALAGALA